MKNLLFFVDWFSPLLLDIEKWCLKWKMHGMTDKELLHSSGDDLSNLHLASMRIFAEADFRRKLIFSVNAVLENVKWHRLL